MFHTVIGCCVFLHRWWSVGRGSTINCCTTFCVRGMSVGVLTALSIVCVPVSHSVKRRSMTLMCLLICCTSVTTRRIRVFFVSNFQMLLNVRFMRRMVWFVSGTRTVLSLLSLRVFCVLRAVSLFLRLNRGCFHLTHRTGRVPPVMGSVRLMFLMLHRVLLVTVPVFVRKRCTFFFPVRRCATFTRLSVLPLMTLRNSFLL